MSDFVCNIHISAVQKESKSSSGFMCGQLSCASALPALGLAAAPVADCLALPEPAAAAPEEEGLLEDALGVPGATGAAGGFVAAAAVPGLAAPFLPFFLAAAAAAASASRRRRSASASSFSLFSSCACAEHQPLMITAWLSKYYRHTQIHMPRDGMYASFENKHATRIAVLEVYVGPSRAIQLGSLLFSAMPMQAFCCSCDRCHAKQG